MQNSYEKTYKKYADKTIELISSVDKHIKNINSIEDRPWEIMFFLPQTNHLINEIDKHIYSLGLASNKLKEKVSLSFLLEEQSNELIKEKKFLTKLKDILLLCDGATHNLEYAMHCSKVFSLCQNMYKNN